MIGCNLKLVIVVVLLLSVINVFTYNIDTEYPIILSSGLNNSYFGYSVSLLRNSDGPWLIAGAPKANSPGQSIIQEPGEIFKCLLNVSSRTHSCGALPLDYKIDHVTLKQEQKDYGWLGVNVDTTSVDHGQVVACGHRWVNKKLTGQRLFNGICYTIDSDFNQTSIKKHDPLSWPRDQYFQNNRYKYAFGQMGTSAQYVKGSNSLLLGAPGVAEWKGTVVRVDPAKPGSDISAYPYTIAWPLSIGHTSYFGYAVTSGNFKNKYKTEFVIGAPRVDYRGRVYIGHMVNKDFIAGVEIAGKQIGEYFGSSVCAVDVNNDQIDDLLVGAPLFGEGSIGDEGKVYVYLNKASVLTEFGNLMGSSVPKARFGSSITSIGDVNRDDYNDVAIGAPYENDRGAIYIYHGGPEGLSHEYKQRIKAEDVNFNVRGFGVSISRGMDVDSNEYLDIVVGAYDSDQAVLLRSRPLIKLSGKIILSSNVVNSDSKICHLNGKNFACFNVTTCLSYTGKSPPPSINVNSKFEVDVLRGSNPDYTRVFLLYGSSRVASISQTLLLKDNVRNCPPFTVYVTEDVNNYFDPIHLKLSYSLSEKKSNEFCPKCPMLEPKKNDLSVNSEVRFLLNCNNEICESDLQLKASFKGLLGSELVIGSRDNLLLEVEVHNAAGHDTAYASRLSLTIPKWIGINRKPVICELITQDLLPWDRLNCSVANRLDPNNTTMLEFNFNTQRISLSEKQLEVNITVDSDSKEINSIDNRKDLNLSITVKADISITGLTVNDQVFYSYDNKGKVAEGEKTTFLHSYEISNKGPSPMESLFIEVSYPSPLTSDGKRIIEIIPEKKQKGQVDLLGLCEGETASSESSGRSSSLDPPDATGERMSRRRRDVSGQSVVNNTDVAKDGGKKSKEYYHLNCSSTIHCDKLKCNIGSVGKDVRASLIVKFIVDVFELKKLMGDLDTAVVNSEGKVYSNDSFMNMQLVDHKSDTATVSTEIKPDGPPLPEKLASWIIPVSVVGGLLLLILIIVGLVKLGFFRRKAREDMEKLKERSGEEPAQSSGQPEQNEAMSDS